MIISGTVTYQPIYWIRSPSHRATRSSLRLRPGGRGDVVPGFQRVALRLLGALRRAHRLAHRRAAAALRWPAPWAPKGRRWEQWGTPGKTCENGGKKVAKPGKSGKPWKMVGKWWGNGWETGENICEKGDFERQTNMILKG